MTHNTKYAYIQYIQMERKKKTKVFNLRLNDNELWLLESVANSYNCTLSKAIIRALANTESYLLKANNYKPILRANKKEFTKDELETVKINVYDQEYWM